MLSPRLTNCPECADIPSLLKKIDCKLAELGNNLYNNISYMLNKPIPAGDILQLIGYRRILTYKYCNPNYVHKYSVQMIASRVIRLTAGCVSRCNEPERCLEDPCEIDIVANPTTTSTTTLTTCQSYILYNTATSAESFLIGNCITGEPQTITLQGLSSVCISTIVALNVSPNIVVISTNECTTTTTSTSSTSSTTTTSTTAVPTTTTTSSSSTSTSTSSTSSTTTSTTTSGLTTTTSTTCSFNHPYNINLIENVTTGGGAVFIGSLIEACAAVSCLNSGGCLPSGLRIGYWDEAVPSVGDAFFANPTDCTLPSTNGWFAINIPGTPGSWQVVHMVNSIIQSYPTC